MPDLGLDWHVQIAYNRAYNSLWPGKNGPDTDKSCSEGLILVRKSNAPAPQNNPNISSFHNRHAVDSFGRLKEIARVLHGSDVNVAVVDVISAYVMGGWISAPSLPEWEMSDNVFRRLIEPL
jgi:hypothetical protein